MIFTHFSNRRELQTAVKARVLNQFGSSLHQIKENDKDNKIAVLYFQTTVFLTKILGIF